MSRFHLNATGRRLQAPTQDSRMPTNCSAVASILDAHFNSPTQQRRDGTRTRTFVSFHGGNGVGDEVNGFLLSLVASLVRGRRLEIAPQPTSYLSAFAPTFDLNYTGPADALEAVPRAIRSFANVTTECSRRGRDAVGCNQAFCRAGTRSCSVMPRENRYVPRPFDVALTRSWLQHMPTDRVERLLSEVGVTYGRMYDLPKTKELIVTLFRPSRSRFKFTRRVEFIAGFAEGGGGKEALLSYLSARISADALPHATGCALRHLLRPSPAAASMIEALRPPFWPRRHPHSPSSRPRVAVHVRALSAVINRDVGKPDAHYRMVFAPDASMGCTPLVEERAYLQRAMARGLDEGVFGAYWDAARRAERLILLTARTSNRSERESGSIHAAHEDARALSDGKRMANVSEAEHRVGSWLLATDSPRLKESVRAGWPEGSCVTGDRTRTIERIERCADYDCANVPCSTVGGAGELLRYTQVMSDAATAPALLSAGGRVAPRCSMAHLAPLVVTSSRYATLTEAATLLSRRS